MHVRLIFSLFPAAVRARTSLKKRKEKKVELLIQSLDSSSWGWKTPNIMSRVTFSRVGNTISSSASSHIGVCAPSALEPEKCA